MSSSVAGRRCAASYVCFVNARAPTFGQGSLRSPPSARRAPPPRLEHVGEAEALPLLGRHEEALDRADRSASSPAPAGHLRASETAFDALQVADSALLALGRPSDALERIGRAMALNPHPPQPWFLRARASVMMGGHDPKLEESLVAAAATSPRLAREAEASK